MSLFPDWLNMTPHNAFNTSDDKAPMCDVAIDNLAAWFES